MKRLSGLLIACAFIAGCSSQASYELIGEAKTPVSPTEVVVYETLPQQFSEIAVISAARPFWHSASEQSRTEDVLKLMRKEAAALGANAIVVTNLEDEVVNVGGTIHDGKHTGVIDQVRFYRKGQGLAIYVE